MNEVAEFAKWLILTVNIFLVIIIIADVVVICKKIAVSKHQRSVRIKLLKKLKKMMNNPINLLILKCMYLASLDVLRDKNEYVDPYLTIVLNNQPIDITMSEIEQMLLENSNKSRKKS